MKIIFAGTPDFSVPTLRTLIESDHDVVAVYTQPDRPKGRGRHLTESPVKAEALLHSIPVEQPLTLRDAAAQEKLNSYAADLMVVVAYGLILPKAVLDSPKWGCINVHASLLPRWRGASPIQQALLAGDKETGVTIMKMDVGLDSGDMLLKRACEIQPDDTSKTLHDRLCLMGANALLEVVNQIEHGQAHCEKQDEAHVTFAPKIKKAQAKICWEAPAVEIERQVRAYNPWPVSFGELDGKSIRVWEAVALNEKTQTNPGTIERFDKDAVCVATGCGLLAIKKLQVPGGKPIRAEDFINAYYS